MGFADLHLHSVYSVDGSSSVEAILHQAQKRHLDVIAITDHNSMKGVPEALTLMKKYQVQVIPAMEISTKDGHLLAYEITQPIRRGLPFKETVLKVHAQGGFCSIPHPMSIGTDAIRSHVITEALKHPTVKETILGIEIINGGILRRNRYAVDLPAQYELAAVGNSDGHNIDAIGRVITQFEGHTIQDLKTALRQRNTNAQWHHRTVDPVYYAEHLLFRMIRQAGYGIHYNSTKKRLQIVPVNKLKKIGLR